MLNVPFTARIYKRFYWISIDYVIVYIPSIDLRKQLTLSLRQAGAVSKIIFDCFFLVCWVHLNDIYQILGGWSTRCLETSMYHIWYNRIERVPKWTILNQCFLFIGAFIYSDIIIWNGKYGKNASSILFTSVQSPYMYQIKCKYGRFYP